MLVHEHSFSISQNHLDALRSSVPRHLLLWCALEQLCEEASRRVSDPVSIKMQLVPKPSEEKARLVLDVVLLASEGEVERYFADEGASTRRLIAHGAGPDLLRQGKLFAARGESPDATWDWKLVEQEDARQRRALATNRRRRRASRR
ncbi:DUF6357 family protein [Microbacterium sp. MPKO10]|uniref:DUF6357 family protein n=1 Tax=Microbacterium sp. MPKO10 TaxID=2989818 RepID=UPI002235B3F4|nr:DUF6357 family protein [Microbacterium sp. MPKO10]MCW4457993.1 DUF6357 family protein [Microbacterium sp. MPKO10]